MENRKWKGQVAWNPFMNVNYVIEDIVKNEDYYEGKFRLGDFCFRSFWDSCIKKYLGSILNFVRYLVNSIFGGFDSYNDKKKN